MAVMPADAELITMVGIFNCLTILIMMFSCRIVPVELMPMHLWIEMLPACMWEGLNTVDRP